jgi:hypothetical protein
MYGDLREDEVDRVVDALRSIHDNAEAVAAHSGGSLRSSARE